MATYFGFEAYDVERGSDPFVFISYKSEDWEQVAVYARYLHDHGINVWYDNGLHAGSDWESYLMTVIEKPNCKAVLLFVSAKVADSTVIPLETTQARACKKPTVAIYLEPGLNLETLLNKAIRVYVEQRQSVNAYIGTENSVCAQVLEAARMAMDNKPIVTSTSADTLWKNANMFLMNARRSRSEEDVSKARGYLTQLTEQEPSDYRGWLGLAMCACLRRPESLESAHEQFREGAKYYSYVVASGADDIASAEYTEVKSRLWEDTLGFIRHAFSSCTGLEELKQLRERVEQLGYHFGHTEQHLRSDYERSIAAMDERIRMLEDEKQKAEQEAEAERLRLEKEAAEKAAEKAAKEAEIKAIVDQCEWEENADGGMTLKKYIGQSSSYDIPAEVDGRSVTNIGDQAFAGIINLTLVTIPNGVKGIGDHSFAYCSNLTSVTIPNSVNNIGWCAFEGCSSLTSITVPNSVTVIDAYAFWHCTGLTSITIPDGVTCIEQGVLKGCSSLTTIVIPDSVTSIGEYAFAFCDTLTSVTIPNSVTDIGENAFIGCKKLTVRGEGGFLSPMRKAARKSRVRYYRIKPQTDKPTNKINGFLAKRGN